MSRTERPHLVKAHPLRPLADLVDLDRETKEPEHGEQLKAIGSERLRELVVMASNLLPLTDARVANQIARARWAPPEVVRQARGANGSRYASHTTKGGDAS